MTKRFRRIRARQHFGKAREAAARYRAAIDGWGATVGAVVDELAELGLGESAPCPSKRPRGAGDAWEAGEPVITVAGVPVRAVEWFQAEADAATSSARWHKQRARGQRFRFANLRACGSRLRFTSCSSCGLDSTKTAVPEGCGISRLCSRCALADAKEKRARFGRARARTILGASQRARRVYREMMLTVTVPHFDVADVAAHVDELAAGLEDPGRHDGRSRRRDELAVELGRELLARAEHDTVRARVEALWMAWPRFTRKIVAHWRANRETVGGGKTGQLVPRFHRAAEWTPGDDGRGHPHFHVWLWAPWLPWELVRAWWGEALAEIGWPPARTRDRLPVVDVKKIHSFNFAMGAELLKGGKRDALTLSKLTFRQRASSGEDVFAYADGWTIHEVLDVATADVIASLYCALEGKRLSQGSSGFFGQDEPRACRYCGCVGEWSTRFERAHDHGPIATRSPPTSSTQEARPPP